MADRKIPQGINYHFLQDSDLKKRGIISTRSLSIILTYLIMGEEEDLDDDMVEDIAVLMQDVIDTAETM